MGLVGGVEFFAADCIELVKLDMAISISFGVLSFMLRLVSFYRRVVRVQIVEVFNVMEEVVRDFRYEDIKDIGTFSWGLTAYSILIIFVSSCSHYYFVMEKTFLKKKVMGGAAKNRNAKKIKLQQVAQEAKTITSFFNKQTKPEPIDAQLIQQPAVVLQLDKLIEEQEYSVDYPDDHDRSVSLNIEQPVLFTNEDDTMDNMV
ncbi:hypothetical protein QTP88_025069 [Uroleucon formosanum]